MFNKLKREREPAVVWNFVGSLPSSYRHFVFSDLSSIVTACVGACETYRVAMGMAIKAFLLLLVLFFSSTNPSFSLYEDQVGLMDW